MREDASGCDADSKNPIDGVWSNYCHRDAWRMWQAGSVLPLMTLDPVHSADRACVPNHKFYSANTEVGVLL